LKTLIASAPLLAMFVRQGAATIHELRIWDTSREKWVGVELWRR
jgi:hypothetical protein